MKRQLTIAGTDDGRSAELDEALEVAREKRDRLEQAKLESQMADSIVLKRMMEAERIGYQINHEQYDIIARIELPEPVLRFKVERHKP